MSLEQSRLSTGLGDTRRKPATSRINKDSNETSRHSFASFSTCEEDLSDVLTDMEDPCLVEEATVMDAREVTIETPKIPERSALRTSRFLDDLKLNSAESTVDPHDIYLSSEEDASSSADDFSDYDYDSDTDEPQKSPIRRKSQEDTARAVSVIFIGKPCVVDLTSGRRSASPIRRPRTRSSSPSVRADSFEGRPSHPPRKSSLASTIDMPNRDSLSFLSQDPFAASNYKLEGNSKEAAPACSSPRVPKAPTAAFHRLQKSLSLVRRRSRPNLKDLKGTWAAGSASTTNLSLDLDLSRTSREEPLSASTSPPPTPAIYHTLTTLSRRSSTPRVLTKQPPSIQPMSPGPIGAKRGLLSGLNINRRRSLQIKS
ncbi:uncharacterized protein GGS25DRAFT_287492 [Hypoxylon fragiforme]|uniref:uncharacterized protein n=1 Tax=Hypoxylon fragiforme TaxID=63214 RepID=UPI0020C6EC1F|nr:uncharacterized protein GGS25DRAFT_287492 [Hypoxylon fragiforme]KAI2608690.1 hypothetical protein GGS25DRAFT_287492 [Hypoxylon fragiforme]